MVNEIRILVSAEDKASAAMKGVQANAASMGDSIAKTAKQMTVAFAAVGAAGGVLGLSAVKAASDLQESQTKITAVFGEQAEAIRAWAAESAIAFGQSTQQALEAAGTYGNLFQAFGVVRGAAADMSTTLVELAADLASFNNTSIDDALIALRSGLSGETEPLKRFGIVINDVRLKDAALRLGLIETTKQALDPAAKAQAAYALIMKDSTLAQGDFRRTSDGLANSMRQLQAQIANAQAELGTKLLPIMAEAARTAIALSGNMDILKAAVVGAGGAIALATVPITGPAGMIVALGLLGGASFLMKDQWEESFAALPPAVLSALAGIAKGAEGIANVIGETVNVIIKGLNILLEAANRTAKVAHLAAGFAALQAGGNEAAAQAFDAARNVAQFQPIPEVNSNFGARIAEFVNNARLDQRAANAGSATGDGPFGTNAAWLVAMANARSGGAAGLGGGLGGGLGAGALSGAAGSMAEAIDELAAQLQRAADRIAEQHTSEIVEAFLTGGDDAVAAVRATHAQLDQQWTGLAADMREKLGIVIPDEFRLMWERIVEEQREAEKNRLEEFKRTHDRLVEEERKAGADRVKAMQEGMRDASEDIRNSAGAILRQMAGPGTKAEDVPGLVAQARAIAADDARGRAVQAFNEGRITQSQFEGIVAAANNYGVQNFIFPNAGGVATQPNPGAVVVG